VLGQEKWVDWPDAVNARGGNITRPEDKRLPVGMNDVSNLGRDGRPLARDSRQRLQSTVEEYETALEELKSANEELVSINEELQSANEEIQSGNEELKSTNEELQTSKEELESANEELNTVNEEIQHRNQQLAQLSSDLINLLNSATIPMVMLGENLHIRRFTPEAERVFGFSTRSKGDAVSDRLKGWGRLSSWVFGAASRFTFSVPFTLRESFSAYGD